MIMLLIFINYTQSCAAMSQMCHVINIDISLSYSATYIQYVAVSVCYIF